MCGIIAIKTDSFNNESLILLKQLFIESKIRGLHATGISLINNGKLKTIKKPLSADKFINKVPLEKLLGKELSLIGHTRYSTSDIEFNQPIANDVESIVHNGVITQETANNWSNKYNMTFKTKNDTEILFNTLLNNNDPYSLTGATMGVIRLNNKNEMYCFRNGERPMWKATYNNSLFISSTKDILDRTFNECELQYDEIKKVECGIIYKVEYNKLTSSTIKTKMLDIQ